MKIRWSLFIKSFILGVSFLILFFGLATVSRAEKKEEGMYFSILGVENSIGGDFDGETSFYKEEEDTGCVAPKIDSHTGFGILIGGYNERMAGEISYLHSVHDTTFTDYDTGISIPLDGEVELINLDLKLFFSKRIIKPYFLFGIVIPKITIDMAAIDGSEVGDAIYTGYGLNLGLGTEIKIHHKFGIDGSIVFRGMRINRIEISGTDWKPEDSFYTTGRSYNIKLNYYF